LPEANPEDSNWLGAGKVIGIGATNSARLIHVASDLGGLGAPANAVVFLASDNALDMTGAGVVVDGGVLVQQRSAPVDVFPVSRFPEVPVE